MALKQVIYLYIAVLLLVAPLVYLLLDDFDESAPGNKTTNTNFKGDLITVLRHKEIWLCAICIICGYQLFYATYSFSAYLQENFGLSAVAVGTITVAKLWMRPIGGIAAGFIGDWSSPEKVLCILLVLASLALAVMAFLPTTSASILMIIVVLLIGLLTYGVRGLYWATLGGCNVPNKIKGLAIGMISMIGYFPEFYLPLISAYLLELYPGTAGYKIYYLIISIFGVLGACAAYLLGRPKAITNS
jgi:nitrate/nitrite transporter NarK